MKTPMWLTVVLGVLLGLGSLVYGLRLHDLNGELGQFRAQTAAAQHANGLLTRQLISANEALQIAASRIGGNHRDLITCGDLQQLDWIVSGLDSLNGSVAGSAGPGPAQLPSHCINQ